MTEEISMAELAAFVEASRKRFGDNPIEWGASIATIWMVGATEKLQQLGVIGGGNFKVIDGIELWDSIDKMRFYLLPPEALKISAKAFTEVTVDTSIQEEVANIIAIYYTESGREQLTKAALEYLFTSKP